MTPNAEKMALVVGSHPKPVDGNTVSLYCDECGELYCEHRPDDLSHNGGTP